MNVQDNWQVEKTADMQMTRMATIICMMIAGSIALHLTLGGSLLVWIVAAWLISGPIVVVDAHFRKDENPGKKPAGFDAVREPSIRTAGVNSDKLSRSQTHDTDIQR